MNKHLDILKQLIVRISAEPLDDNVLTEQTRFIEDLGFDSVKSIMLATLVETSFELDLSEEISQLMTLKSLGDVCQFIDSVQERV